MAHRRSGQHSAADPLRPLLESWQKSLIDLGFRNRLVHYRRSSKQAGADIIGPGMAQVLDALPRGCLFAQVPEKSPAPVQPGPDLSKRVGDTAAPLSGSRPIDTPASRAGSGTTRLALRTSKATQAEQDRHLKRLATVAQEKYNDYGLWVLHLGVGFLQWRPAADADPVASPLLLMPVRLRRWKGESFLLELNGDEELSFNPALAVKMEEMGVEWPAPEQIEPTDAPDLLEQVRRAVSARTDWQVGERIVLDAFNSSKEVMYRDLRDNANRILGSPLVRTLGLGADAAGTADSLGFDPIPLELIDKKQPPEKAPLVLDADSSQRQCVAAALDGRSFVMDGPPGTGKSQTITNMIAGLLEKGRSVLFVSEKAAALDVVRNRLAEVGLDDYVLALHSNTANRKQVAQELGRSLVAPRRSFPAARRDELLTAKDLRRELSGYAAAMNERHEGMNRSLHAVLGRVSLLHTLPQLAPEPDFDAVGLTEERLRGILDGAHWVSRSWRPALEGKAFAWRGLGGTGGELDALARTLEDFAALRGALAPHASLIGAMEWDGLRDAERLIEALRLCAARPVLPQSWLETDASRVADGIRTFERRLDTAETSERLAKELLGPHWAELTDPSIASGPGPQEEALTELIPSGLDLSGATAEQATALADRLADDARNLERARRQLANAARVYGVPAPESCAQGLRLVSLAELSLPEQHEKPPARWLTPEGAARARTALRRLSDAVVGLRTVRDRARRHFTERVVEEADLVDVAQRFATVHRSLTARMSSSYRADRRTVRTLLPEGAKCTKQVLMALPDAVAWQQAQQRLEQEDRREGELLGHFWRGEETDFAAAEQALGRAERAIELAPRLVDPGALSAQLAHGGQPRPAARDAAMEAGELLTAWRDSLVFPPLLGAPCDLEGSTLVDAARWSSAHIAPLREAARLLECVGGVSRRDGRTVAEARAAIAAARAARAADEEFAAHAEQDRDFLGTLYSGRATARAALDQAAAWLQRLRKVCLLDEGVFPAEASRILHQALPDSTLEEAKRLWDRSCVRLAGMFDDQRGGALRTALSVTASAGGLLTLLNGDRGGPDEWAAFQRGQRALEKAGLGDLTARAVRAGIAPEDFPQVVEKSVLHSWADRVIQNDRRLVWNRAKDRDDKVAAFRDIDRALAEHARLRVASTCDMNRPEVLSSPGTRLIQHEGKKKMRHKPVHLLLREAGKAALRVKPCFMMSPLTVSRFIPPDLTFDVVIFDEASQILPQDAINCIYRAKVLIVAGDENQLPPTAFFTAGDNEEDDPYAEEELPRYESLLSLAKGNGMLKELSLRWHYRSRHEHLIAFSNRQFYDGAMTTFPGAFSEGPDVGVAFFKAEQGVYRSGAAARNNPGEAVEVARRVIHHFRTRPHHSLGVVALSQSQAEVIREAVESERKRNTDLDECFSDDRLDGFFIKNLEAVQGDERDVIIMSVGYGPDENGKLNQNFGPINRKDGWRRLNVAVTRARHRVEVVASFEPELLRPSESASFEHFARYLKYAKYGPVVLAQEADDTDAIPESPFEESVLEVLRGWGYTVQPQVGVAGYRIDLGVRDPQNPGRYALGIECDGAMYHSSRAARDRDRLRESMLTGLGWTLHRIWGTDWYRNRVEAEARLRSAVERAVARSVKAAPQHSSASVADAPEATRAPAASLAPRAVPTARQPSSSSTPPVAPLLSSAEQRIRHELEQLRAELEQQSGVSGHDSRPRARTDQQRRQRGRTEELEERAALLKAYLTGDRRAAADAVCPGRLVRVAFEGEQQEYEITSQEPYSADVEKLSPFTPLGQALLGRTAGSHVEYEHDGRRMAVSLLAVSD
jgi:transcription elongation GreA/GreB family factor/very-short-patch-repair endonuclease